MNNYNDCYPVTVKDERMCKMCKSSLHLTHEVADSRMIFYLNLNALTNLADFVIPTSDTEVLVITLRSMGSVSSYIKVPFLLS